MLSFILLNAQTSDLNLSRGDAYTYGTDANGGKGKYGETPAFTVSGDKILVKTSKQHIGYNWITLPINIPKDATRIIVTVPEFKPCSPNFDGSSDKLLSFILTNIKVETIEKLKELLDGEDVIKLKTFGTKPGDVLSKVNQFDITLNSNEVKPYIGKRIYLLCYLRDGWDSVNFNFSISNPYVSFL